MQRPHIIYRNKLSMPVKQLAIHYNTAVVAIIATTILRFILVCLNSRLDRGEEVEGAVLVALNIESREFRYRI